MKIRIEENKDYRKVEELTKKAFWNVNVPGCNEHYLLHVLRAHPDYIHDLCFVAEKDGQIIGSIVYTRCKLIALDGSLKDVLTFGPLSVHPAYQRQGIGKQLQYHSFEKALELGYDAVVIFGNPGNYITTGFKSCKQYNVKYGEHFPVALLVKELRAGALSGKKWRYEESSAFDINEADVENFDKDFELMEKGYQASQELFSIFSKSVIAD